MEKLWGLIGKRDIGKVGGDKSEECNKEKHNKITFIFTNNCNENNHV